MQCAFNTDCQANFDIDLWESQNWKMQFIKFELQNKSYNKK